MSYMNGNNIYGVRNMNERPSRSYVYDKNRERMEIQEEMSTEKECSCNLTEVENNNCNQQQSTCNKTCENTSDKWNCGVTSKCCTGDSCTFDPSKVKCICTYMDILFNEEKISGSPILYSIEKANSQGYNIEVEYKPSNPNCCTPCVIDSTSKFTIESSSVAIQSLVPTGPLDPNSILVNGSTVVATLLPNGSIVAQIPTTYLDDSCSCNCKGTKVSVLLSSIQPWNLVSKINLCGSVTTKSAVCRFIASFTNTLPGVNITLPSTFVSPEICIPGNENTKSIILNIDFSGIGQLITPVLSTTLSDPEDPTAPLLLELNGNMIISPNANLEIMENTKVCFNAMV